MKRKLVAGATVACLLVTLGVFSVGGVYAFQATDTPTQTITAVGGYIPTINSTQALNLNCNSGTPIGWGTVTPDSVWSVLCSSCMSTAFPSSTVAVTSSPTLGIGTPSATVSPTASPTVTPAGFCTAIGVGAVTVSYPVFGYPTDGDVQYSVNCFVTGDNLIVCDGHLHAIDTTLNSSVEQAVELDVELFGLSIGDVGYYVTTDYADLTFYGHFDDILQIGVSQSNCLAGQVLNAPRSGTCTMSGEAPSSLRWHFTIAGAGAGGSAVVHEFYFHTVISFGNDCTGGDQSTPTVTPTSSFGYCEQVNGGGAVPDTGFEFNGITFGSTACFDIGPIPTWDFGFLVVNVNIPWIAHLCLTNIDLGVITAFGVQISLLTISYVWGIAWAIRNLFTS